MTLIFRSHCVRDKEQRKNRISKNTTPPRPRSLPTVLGSSCWTKPAAGSPVSPETPDLRDTSSPNPQTAVDTTVNSAG